MSPPLKRGMTAAAFQSLGISDNTKERLNRLVIGVATISSEYFRKRGSRLSSPEDLEGARFCSSFRTSAIWIWVKEKWRRLGQVALGSAELLTGVGVASWKAWPVVEKCLLKFSIIGFISGDSVVGGVLILHGRYSVPKQSSCYRMHISV